MKTLFNASVSISTSPSVSPEVSDMKQDAMKTDRCRRTDRCFLLFVQCACVCVCACARVYNEKTSKHLSVLSVRSVKSASLCHLVSSELRDVLIDGILTKSSISNPVCAMRLRKGGAR